MHRRQKCLAFYRFVGFTPKQWPEPRCPAGHGLGAEGQVPPSSSLNSVDLFHSKLPRDWGSGGILTFVSPFCWTVGVCNTDNFSLLSITIDYGPFGFMDSYDPSECSTCFLFVLLFFFSLNNLFILNYIVSIAWKLLSLLAEKHKHVYCLKSFRGKNYISDQFYDTLYRLHSRPKCLNEMLLLNPFPWDCFHLSTINSIDATTEGKKTKNCVLLEALAL